MTDLFAVPQPRDLIDVVIVLHDPDRRLLLGGRTIGDSTLLIRLAHNLEQARSALNARRPDLVLAGVNLPDGRATDLLDATGLACGCPVVVVTEPGEAALAERARAAGALDHLPRAALTAKTLQEICVRAVRLWHEMQGREKAERALAALQRHHERTLETALDGYLVLDAFGTLREASDTYLALTGFQRDALEGARLCDFIESPAALEEALKLCTVGGFARLEIRHRTADGGVLDLDLQLARLERPGKRRITAFIHLAVTRDTSLHRRLERELEERDEAERALRESERRFEALFNQVHNFIGVLTPAGEFIDINEGSLRSSGIRREDVVGRFLWETPWWVDVPEEREKAMLVFERVRRGESVRDETSFRQAEGSLGQAVRSFKPLFDADGEVTSVILEGHDITDRLDAEQKIHDYAQRLQVLSQQLLVAQENERRHIARELHDEIGQALTALKLNLHAASERIADNGEHPYFDDSADIIERLLGQVRALSLDLRPSMLDDLGLGAALRWYCGRQGQRSGIEFSVSLDPRIERLRPEVETACYRIAQEAVTNVVKHARGSRTEVRVVIRNDELELVVADDGIGFDVAERHSRAIEGTSFGLVGMQERALLVGGEFQVESSPGHSATIRARFPLD